MKVLFSIASVDPAGGGPVEGLLQGARAMQSLGVESEIVSLDSPDAEVIRGVPFPVHGMGPVTLRYGYTPRLARWVADNARRFDVAVLNGLWNYSSYGPWRGLRGTNLPYVIFAHGMLDPWFNSVQPVKRWAKQAYWLAAEGRVLADARMVLFTSEEERLRARTSFWGHKYRERVVAYGSSDVPDNEAAQRAAFGALLPALGDRPYLLFMSRIHPKKGADLLVTAFAGIAAAHPDIDLVIAGPDQVGLKATLQDQAQSLGIGARIHWPGMLTGDAKWGALRRADAFVLPSHQENFGIVVAEAMAAGTPVLISNKVNIWREVEASAGGLVEEDTVAGTKRLLDRFIGLSPEQRRAMGSAARQGYERHFGLAAAASSLLAVLRSVSSGNDRAA